MEQDFFEFEPADKEASTHWLRHIFWQRIASDAEDVVNDLFRRCFGIFRRLGRHSSSYQDEADSIVDLGFRSLKEDDWLDWDFEITPSADGFFDSKDIFQPNRHLLRKQLVREIEAWGLAHGLTDAWCHEYAFNVIQRFWKSIRGEKTQEKQGGSPSQPVEQKPMSYAETRWHKSGFHVDWLRFVIERGHTLMDREREEREKELGRKDPPVANFRRHLGDAVRLNYPIQVRPTALEDNSVRPRFERRVGPHSLSSLLEPVNAPLTAPASRLRRRSDEQLRELADVTAQTSGMPNIDHSSRPGDLPVESTVPPLPEPIKPQEIPHPIGASASGKRVDTSALSSTDPPFLEVAKVAIGFLLQRHRDCWKAQADEDTSQAKSHLHSNASPRYWPHPTILGLWPTFFSSQLKRDPTDEEPPRPPTYLPRRIDFAGQYIKTRKEYEKVVKQSFLEWFAFDLNEYLPVALKERCVNALLEHFHDAIDRYGEEFDNWLKRRGWIEVKERQKIEHHIQWLIWYAIEGLSHHEIADKIAQEKGEIVTDVAVGKAIRDLAKAIGLTMPSRKGRRKKQTLEGSKKT